MHKFKSKKMIVLIVVCFIIMSMTVVCASFNQDMFISGNAYVRSPKDVRIIKAVLKSELNGAKSNSVKYSSKNLIVDASLPNYNSEVVYTVMIENKSGSVAYIINNITESLSNSYISNNSSEYVNQLLQKYQIIEVDISFKYDNMTSFNSSTQKVQTGMLTFSFAQPSASMISFSSSYTSKDTVQDAIDELYTLLN